MKKIRVILLALLSLTAIVLQAQVIESHQKRGIGKMYMKNIDSLVYEPAQNWDIQIKVDSFYMDSGERVHVVASVTVGPDAHVAKAAIGRDLQLEHLAYDSVKTVSLQAGITQCVDFVVPNPEETYILYVATKNNYNAWNSQDHWNYYMKGASLNSKEWLERKDWSPWFASKTDWVAAGYAASDWPLGDENPATCTYTYRLYWAGDDPGLRIQYSVHKKDKTRAQFKIENWGSGTSLIIDYETKTHKCQVAPQFAANNSTYGAVTISDFTHWQGSDYYATYPCTFDPKTGHFVLNVAYYVSAGSFGYGPETVQVAGFYIPDYTFEAKYTKVVTDEEKNAFAQIVVSHIGADIERAMACVVENDADDAAVADALVEGDLEGTDLVVGENNIAIDKALSGKLKVVVCTVVEGAIKTIDSYGFEYYAEENNPWLSLGMGLYTEGIVCSLYDIEAQTYEVEIQERKDTPGLYRIVDPYGEKWNYAAMNTMTPASYLEINATDAEGVYIAPQMLGVNLESGDTELGFASMGGYYYESGAYTLEELKGTGMLGKVINGVITFPTMSNGSQGVVYYGSKAYYGGQGIQIVLPEAVSNQTRSLKVKGIRTDVPKLREKTQERLIDKKVKIVKPSLSLKKFK
ncbi:MAG: hypothetical protein J6R05_02915 [Bacteroidaceae bacterium]|nr:hypothetical protein [Bacteroidaceae bacterium]